MSDLVKTALIIAGAALLVTGLKIYFSPFHTCVRAEGHATAAQQCAMLLGGRR